MAGKLYFGDVWKRVQNAGLKPVEIEKPGTAIRIQPLLGTVPLDATVPDEVAMVILRPDSVGLFDEDAVNAAIEAVNNG